MSEDLVSIRRPLDAHVWVKDPDGWYVEPQWVSERLFAVEKFSGDVWDPACGMGRIPDAAQAAGHAAVATDLVDRGYQHFSGQFDFLRTDRPLADNVVCNPPFDHADAFAQHALELARGKVEMVWLARRLNAARWLTDTPLARIYLLTPRPSMPPGHVIMRGEKPGGGTQDFVWLVWTYGYVGPPEMHWLHRDGRTS